MNKPKYQVVGLTEKVRIFGKKKEAAEIARIDTGATKSSIDTKLAATLGAGPIIRTKLVKSASGRSFRPVVKIKVGIGKKRYEAEFTVADRSHMKYKVLIGQNILKQGFLIDPQRTYEHKKVKKSRTKSKRRTKA